MESKKLHPLIVYSGGLDSTALLWRALQAGDVYTCYIEGHQAIPKVTMELRKRQRSMAVLQELSGNRIISDSVVECKPRMTEYTWNHEKELNHENLITDGTWQQPSGWLYSLLYVTNSNKHSSVELGYVMGDSIATQLYNIIDAWDRLQQFSKHKPIPMEFPLMHTSKLVLLRDLPPEVFEHLWTCELPEYGDGQDNDGRTNYVRCDKCHPCITMRLLDLEHQIHNHRTVEEEIARKLKHNEGIKNGTIRPEDHDRISLPNDGPAVGTSKLISADR